MGPRSCATPLNFVRMVNEVIYEVVVDVGEGEADGVDDAEGVGVGSSLH